MSKTRYIERFCEFEKKTTKSDNFLGGQAARLKSRVIPISPNALQKMPHLQFYCFKSFKKNKYYNVWGFQI